MGLAKSPRKFEHSKNNNCNGFSGRYTLELTAKGFCNGGVCLEFCNFRGGGDLTCRLPLQSALFGTLWGKRREVKMLLRSCNTEI